MSVLYEAHPPARMKRYELQFKTSWGEWLPYTTRYRFAWMAKSWARTMSKDSGRPHRVVDLRGDA